MFEMNEDEIGSIRLHCLLEISPTHFCIKKKYSNFLTSLNLIFSHLKPLVKSCEWGDLLIL